jgi:hypothetical protein
MNLLRSIIPEPVGSHATSNWRSLYEQRRSTRCGDRIGSKRIRIGEEYDGRLSTEPQGRALVPSWDAGWRGLWDNHVMIDI